MVGTNEERAAAKAAEENARQERRAKRAERKDRRATLLEHIYDKVDDFEDGVVEEPAESVSEGEVTEDVWSMEDFEREYVTDKEGLYQGFAATLTNLDHYKEQYANTRDKLEATRKALITNKKVYNDLVVSIEQDQQRLQLSGKLDQALKEKRKMEQELKVTSRLLQEATQQYADLEETLERSAPMSQSDINAIVAKSADFERQIEEMETEIRVLKDARYAPRRGAFPTPSPQPEVARGRVGSRVPSLHRTPSVVSVRGSSASRHSHHEKEAHAKEPSPLTDGKEPSFRNWEKAMKTFFTMRHQSYARDEMKMGAIYNCTAGAAQIRLSARYLDNEHPYLTSEEMFEDLQNAFVDPNRQGNAKLELNKMRMGDNEHFTHFEQRFHQLASDSKLPKSAWREELLEKITTFLQTECIVSRDNYDSYEGIKKHLDILDQRTRTIKQHMVARAAPRAKSPFPTLQRPTPSNLPFVRPQSAPNAGTVPAKPVETRHCYNCKQQGHITKDCKDLRTTVAEMSGTQAMDFMEEAAAAETAEGVSGNGEA